MNPVQHFLVTIIDTIAPFPESKVLAGMLLGVDQIPVVLKQQFKSTSTIHILVVSGQNLSILAGFLMTLAPFLGRKKTIILNLGMIVGYSMLTGLGVPVIRAAIMAGLVLIAQLLGRESNSLWILCVTGLVMIGYNHEWITSISFQLSFLATLGALIAPKLIEKYLHFVPELIRGDLSVSIVVQILTLPIIASNFQQVSLLGIVANLFILWTVSLIMILGLIGLVAGMISFWLGKLLVLPAVILITYMMIVIRFFSAVPFAQINLPVTPLTVWVGYYLIVFAIGWKLVYLSNDKRTT